MVLLLLLIRIRIALEVHIPPFFSSIMFSAWPFIITWKTNCILSVFGRSFWLLYWKIYFVHSHKSLYWISYLKKGLLFEFWYLFPLIVIADFAPTSSTTRVTVILDEFWTFNLFENSPNSWKVFFLFHRVTVISY